MYCPVEVTNENVTSQFATWGRYGWADPADPSEVDFEHSSRLTYNSLTGCYELVELNHGRPIKPGHKTGLTGRGRLGKWGVNQTSYLLIVKRSLVNRHRILVIKSKHSEVRKLPGGFIQNKQLALTSAINYLLTDYVQEQARIHGISEMRARVVFANIMRGWLESITADVDNENVSTRGCLEDPRNTDNAWIETTAFVIVLPIFSMDLSNPIQKVHDERLQWVDLDIAMSPEFNMDSVQQKIILDSLPLIRKKSYNPYFIVTWIIVVLFVSSVILVPRERILTPSEQNSFLMFNLDH